MDRIGPLPPEELTPYADLFRGYEHIVGFVPGTVLTMARVPGLVEGYVGMASAAAMSGLIGDELAQLVGHVTSAASGCRYCQAHTAAHAAHLGVAEEKLVELWSFETSEHFDDAERAALQLAFHAGQHPNAATDDDFAACRAYFSDEQITAIVAVCSLFGFLNRWNDTMATTLEGGAARHRRAGARPTGLDRRQTRRRRCGSRAMSRIEPIPRGAHRIRGRVRPGRGVHGLRAQLPLRHGSSPRSTRRVHGAGPGRLRQRAAPGRTRPAGGAT